MVVAVDQRKKPMARIHVTSKRSISHPTGSVDWYAIWQHGTGTNFDGYRVNQDLTLV
jgi:hypothetical protein